MMLHGEISRDGQLYGVIVEALGAYGQGKTREAACRSLARFVQDMAAERGALGDFAVTVTDDGEATVFVTSNDPPRLLSLLLREQRTLHGLSLADVATRTGARSRNGYAQYELGKTEPTLTKLQALLDVVAPELVVAIVPRTARVIPRWDEDADASAQVPARKRTVG
jgi:hypothetical protein